LWVITVKTWRMSLHPGVYSAVLGFRVLDAPFLRIAKGCYIEASGDSNCKLKDANHRLVGCIKYFWQDRPPYLITNTNRTLYMEPLIGPYHEDSRFDVVYLNCKRRVMASMFGFMVCLDWPYVWRLHRYKIVYRLYTDRSVLEKEMETGAVERRRVQILRVARRSDVHSVQSYHVRASQSCSWA
jgi:hypothetical protein